MKLRIRPLDSKQTLKIEVPNTCTLPQLKQTLILQFSLPRDLIFSLNRKDELIGSSSAESLQSLGVTSGDLIYYSRNPSSFSSQTLDFSGAQMGSPFDLSCQDGKFSDLGGSQSLGMSGYGINRGEKGESSSGGGDPIRVRDETLELDTQIEIPQIEEGVGESIEETDSDGTMELDDEDGDEIDGEARFSVPRFLRKVFRNELGDAANGDDHKLVVVAVHAALMESGFVGFDPTSRKKVEHFRVPDEWPSFLVSAHYTLPEILSSNSVQTVVLKFRSLRNYVYVYGSLCEEGLGKCRIQLDISRILPVLYAVWKNNYTGIYDVPDGYVKLNPEKEIFEFWKLVKDGLSLPLMIDLCEKVGLVPPSCFTRLPVDLKMKILELLPAVDLFRVACVCSELNSLSSNNDLWKLKYAEEFGNASGLSRGNRWKPVFCAAWRARKYRRRRICSTSRIPTIRYPYPSRGRNPFNVPDIFGAGSDRYRILGPPAGPYVPLPAILPPQYLQNPQQFFRASNFGRRNR